MVTLEAKGCWIGHDGQVVHCPAYPVAPLDTTGAGDLFSAGFFLCVLQGKPLPFCAHAGALLAAEVVQVLGAELPSPISAQLKQRLL